MGDYEPRHCFVEDGHEPHDWSVDLRDAAQGLPDKLLFSCDGSDVRRDPWDEKELNIENVQATFQEPANAPEIHHSRKPMYGDPAMNMIEQGQMFTAYMSGRPIVHGHDVVVFNILTKLHRFGKVPDYGDSIDDTEGYTEMLRETLKREGIDVIQAKTSTEYQAIKDRGPQTEGRRIDKFAKSHGDPYRNAP